ncbi:hypothetical protein M407DRAFT_203347 [Tulasnella calospora MUT 4182]|uniref:Uncharacterized protein n=1 Tax=Tulasnella calospora MUT 4182 TaxID=1051891 RepID=A0A0C3QJ41_9AGAM|nr:hypothetical protein M407DRAFT_203347 [Tulasnella calospora MUT 4182]
MSGGVSIRGRTQALAEPIHVTSKSSDKSRSQCVSSMWIRVRKRGRKISMECQFKPPTTCGEEREKDWSVGLQSRDGYDRSSKQTVKTSKIISSTGGQQLTSAN